LPLSATDNDVRVLVWYLRKRPGGVTPGEAASAVKKQLFEPAKIAAYESLGLVVRCGDRLKLDAHGRELAQALAPEMRLFRAMLERVEPYRAMLEAAHGQRLDFLPHGEVASFWREHHPAALGIYTPKMVESSVTCFFQICQAAGLGTYIFGKKGQPTRLRLDQEEVLDFLSADAPARAEGGPEPAAGAAPAFISFGRGATATAARVRSLLQLADIEAVMSERAAGGPLLLPSAEAMRRCRAAVFIVTAGLEEILRAEIAAAHLLYQGRLAFLWEEGVPAPEGLKGLDHFVLARGDLAWDEGVRLARAMKELTRRR
jgi:hypothetical protein